MKSNNCKYNIDNSYDVDFDGYGDLYIKMNSYCKAIRYVFGDQGLMMDQDSHTCNFHITMKINFRKFHIARPIL